MNEMKTKRAINPLFTLIAALILISPPALAQKSASDMQLEEIDGTVSKLSQYLREGPVYLSFWALWCEPCKQELRALKKLFKDGEQKPFTIIAVNLDSPKSLAKVKAYVKSQGYPFPVVLDPNSQVFQSFNGQNLPFAVLLDKGGKLATTRTGYYPGDEVEIEQEIMKLVRRWKDGI